MACGISLIYKKIKKVQEYILVRLRILIRQLQRIYHEHLRGTS